MLFSVSMKLFRGSVNVLVYMCRLYGKFVKIPFDSWLLRQSYVTNFVCSKGSRFVDVFAHIRWCWGLYVHADMGLWRRSVNVPIYMNRLWVGWSLIMILYCALHFSCVIGRWGWLFHHMMMHRCYGAFSIAWPLLLVRGWSGLGSVDCIIYLRSWFLWHRWIRFRSVSSFFNEKPSTGSSHSFSVSKKY